MCMRVPHAQKTPRAIRYVLHQELMVVDEVVLKLATPCNLVRS